MRLVFAHVDRVAVEPTERAVEPARSAPEAEAVRAADALAAFVAVESGDGADVEGVAAAAAAAVRDRAARLRVDDVVVCPDPAVSPHAAEGAAAAPVFAALRDALADANGPSEGPDAPATATVAPFGWRTRLDLETKAHPHATAVRSVAAGGRAPAPSDWTVVTADGDVLDPEAVLDDRDPEPGVARALRATVDGLDDPEPLVAAPSGEAPPDRGDRARDLGVADRDPLAPGARLRPVGGFLRDALAAAAAAAAPVDAMPVGGPPAVDLEDDAVRSYAAHLGAGGGLAVGDRRVHPDALGRASALATLADAAMEPAACPVALFDRDAPAPPARDGAGERRTVPGSDRAPTVHVATAAREAARAVAREHAAAATALAAACGLDPLAVARVDPSFRNAHGDWLESLAGALDGPVLVATDPGAPLPLRVDCRVATAAGDALATGTVRVDHDGLARFVDDDAEGAGTPPVVHAAPAGGLRATIAALCDAGAAGREGEPGRGDAPTPLPAWLAPTQVRLVPVADDHVARCEGLADALEAAGVRVDVDDLALAVGDRIGRAERDRVPRYVVVGDDERDGALPVVDAATGRERERDVDALADAVADEVGDRPTAPRPLGRRLSHRPRFRR